MRGSKRKLPDRHTTLLTWGCFVVRRFGGLDDSFVDLTRPGPRQSLSSTIQQMFTAGAMSSGPAAGMY